MGQKRKTHSEFLNDLLIYNDYYRNGYFTVNTKYECTNCLLSVTTKYGECLMKPSKLLHGCKPTIRSASDKTSFYINMCLDRFGEDGNDDLSEIEYTEADAYIKVKCKLTNSYYNIRASMYYEGTRSVQRRSAGYSIAYRLDQDFVFNKIKELCQDLELLPDQVYTSNKDHILVRDKYGVMKVQPHYLLKGMMPSIKSAVNKTEYVINRFKELHGDKYDYSLVEYVNHKTKVKIIGPEGLFYQTPHHHLLGHGSVIEQLQNPTGWEHSSWALAAERSKNFTGYKVYFIECWNENERFYKIGRTYKNVKQRFVGKCNMPYQYNIVYTLELDDPKRICELEQEYKDMHKEYKYIPKIKFRGMHECFSKIIYI